MSIVKKSSAVTAAGAISENGQPMLTPEEVIEQVRAMRDRIPECVPLPKEQKTRRMKRLAQLDPAVVREAINAVGTSNLVQSAIGNTPEELIGAENEMSRWSMAENELRALLEGVSAANLVRRQRLGEAAQKTYNVSRQLSQIREHASLVPHVEEIKRLRKQGRRRSRAAAAPEPPAGPGAK
jgi:lipase chaperone LimK